MENDSKTTHSNRQIVGFSLSVERAREVKAEAASRGISLKTLFEELWANRQLPANSNKSI
jgi:hypothetical protein